jgi:uncharacterized membrane protein YgcG
MAGSAAQQSPQPSAEDTEADHERKARADALLSLLAEPERFGLRPGVFVALDAPDDIVASDPDHTLAGRLGLAPAVLKDVARLAGVWGRGLGWGSTELSRQATVIQRAKAERAMSDSSDSNILYDLREHSGAHYLTYSLQGQPQPTYGPAEQLALVAQQRTRASVAQPGAPPQPAPRSETTAAFTARVRAGLDARAAAEACDDAEASWLAAQLDSTCDLLASTSTQRNAAERASLRALRTQVNRLLDDGGGGGRGGGSGGGRGGGSNSGGGGGSAASSSNAHAPTTLGELHPTHLSRRSRPRDWAVA